MNIKNITNWQDAIDENEALRAEVERRYHPCTYILIEGLKRLEGGKAVLAEWDRARSQVDVALRERLGEGAEKHKDEALLRQALEALIWTTGSEDFSEGGLAREGALKLLFPTITALRERLEKGMEQKA